jgi:hypothetical protein
MAILKLVIYVTNHPTLFSRVPFGLMEKAEMLYGRLNDLLV